MFDEPNNRLLFPNMRLFKNDMATAFTLATQLVYGHHPTYTFNPDDGLTKIMIHPAFADVSNPGKMAKIMFRPGGYDASLNDFTGDNFIGTEVDDDGLAIGDRNSKMIQTTMTVLVQAYSELESQDLADEFAQVVVYAAKEAFANHHVHIVGAQVGETAPLKDQEGSFQTMITVQYKAYLVMSRRYATIKTGDIEIDPDYDKEAGVRFPGVFAFRESNPPNRE